MSSDLDRQAALITRAATYLDQWAAEWAQRWPDDKLTPLGMGDLAVELRGLLPESDPTIEIASTRSAGWVWRCATCDITNTGMDERTARAQAAGHRTAPDHQARLAGVTR